MIKFFIAVVLLAGCTTKSTSYKVGDCLTTVGEIKVYKVTEIGKYSLKAITPSYNEFNEVQLFKNELEKSNRADCFDYFDVHNPLDPRN